MTEQYQPYQPPYPSSPYQLPPTKPAKKRRRVFLWVFLAIQALFLVWIIAGASTASGTPTDCGTLDADTCNAAANAGAAVGVALIIGVWVVVDVLVGGTYAIYRLARRP